MSSTFPSSDSRGWWPSKPNSKDPARRPTPEKRDSQPKVPGNKFNTLASALGLKSTKRPPALAIEQPPPALQSPLSPKPPKKYANRPPSKSVSSTRSRTDSIEPRTPPDLYQDPVGKRQSLLTLSDLDPFAARGIATPHSPSDPNRLSAYSNTSVPEYVSKKPEARGPTHRSSYASSSSTYTGDTGSSPTTMSPAPSADGHAKIPNALPGNLHRKASLLSGDGSLGSAWENMSSNMHSSQTLKEPRLSQPDPTTLISRPPTRPRGMTDVGTSLRHKFVPRDDAVPKVAPPAHVMPRTSPRVVVRQASASRIVAGPSTAPPAAELPPPPSLPADDADFASNSIHQHDSPDDMFFASPTSWDGRPLSPREREKRPWERDFQPLGGYDIDRSLPSSSRSSGSQPSRTLKKSLSHQALVKKAPVPTVPTPPPERDADRQPRKQRSFHHPRTPLSSPQTTNASLPGTPDASTTDHRRSGPGSTRKRLFSGSSMRRPSTSQGPDTDEDVRSVFSLPLAAEHVQRAPLSLSAFHQPSSFWDEGPSEPPRPISPPSTTQQQQQQQQQEYTPQHIMSPADMLKVEASMALEEEAQRQPYIRQRGNSILSSSTCLSDETGEEEYPPSVHRLTAMPSRSTSMVSRKSTGSVPQVSRPSTATNSSAASFRQRSEEQLFLSPQALPPPPRRNRPSTRQGPPAPPAPGPPPPETEAEASEAVDGFSPLSPPPRKILSAKKSMERVTQRRSIMRKPSFLSFDVEDEDDPSDGELDTDSINHIFEGAGDTHDSFLDLARESFDSTRSDYE